MFLNVHINDQVHKNLKIHAATVGKSMAQVVEEAVREHIEKFNKENALI
jgi:predicted HicB family RNase H-like nuclease